MGSQGQIEINPHHRNRLAIVYVRTACVPDSPVAYTGLEAQRAQAEHARAWGWPEGAIQVIEEDVGRSGASAEGRPGYQRLCRMLAAKQVGVILVSDISRLSRSHVDFQTLRDLCERTETLLAVNGVLHPPAAMPSPPSLSEIREEVARWDRALRFFPDAGARPGRSGVETERGRTARNPDLFAREVLARVTAGFTQFGTIGAVSENSACLAKDLPGPAARLLDGVVAILEDFEEACQEWRGREPGESQ